MILLIVSFFVCEVFSAGAVGIFTKFWYNVFIIKFQGDTDVS